MVRGLFNKVVGADDFHPNLAVLMDQLAAFDSIESRLN
jgi:hypothetical protein